MYMAELLHKVVWGAGILQGMSAIRSPYYTEGSLPSFVQNETTKIMFLETTDNDEIH